MGAPRCSGAELPARSRSARHRPDRRRASSTRGSSSSRTPALNVKRVLAGPGATVVAPSGRRGTPRDGHRSRLRPRRALPHAERAQGADGEPPRAPAVAAAPRRPCHADVDQEDRAAGEPGRFRRSVGACRISPPASRSSKAACSGCRQSRIRARRSIFMASVDAFSPVSHHRRGQCAERGAVHRSGDEFSQHRAQHLQSLFRESSRATTSPRAS